MPVELSNIYFFMFVFCTLSLLLGRKRQRWYSFKLNSYISWLHVKPSNFRGEIIRKCTSVQCRFKFSIFSMIIFPFFILLPVRKILMNRLPRQLLCLSGDYIFFLFTIFILIEVLLARKWNSFSSILLDTSRIFTYKEQSRPQLSNLASVYIIALPDWFSPERIKTNLIGQYFTRVTSVTCWK